MFYLKGYIAWFSIYQRDTKVVGRVSHSTDIYRVKSVDDAVWNCVRKVPV